MVRRMTGTPEPQEQPTTPESPGSFAAFGSASVSAGLLVPRISSTSAARRLAVTYTAFLPA